MANSKARRKRLRSERRARANAGRPAHEAKAPLRGSALAALVVDGAYVSHACRTQRGKSSSLPRASLSVCDPARLLEIVLAVCSATAEAEYTADGTADGTNDGDSGSDHDDDATRHADDGHDAEPWPAAPPPPATSFEEAHWIDSRDSRGNATTNRWLSKLHNASFKTELRPLKTDLVFCNNRGCDCKHRKGSTPCVSIAKQVQSGVDVAIAVRMLSLVMEAAEAGRPLRLVLLAGDADFASAIRFVAPRVEELWLVGWRKSMAPEYERLADLAQGGGIVYLDDLWEQIGGRDDDAADAADGDVIGPVFASEADALHAIDVTELAGTVAVVAVEADRTLLIGPAEAVGRVSDVLDGWERGTDATEGSAPSPSRMSPLMVPVQSMRSSPRRPPAAPLPLSFESSSGGSGSDSDIAGQEHMTDILGQDIDSGSDDGAGPGGPRGDSDSESDSDSVFSSDDEIADEEHVQLVPRGAPRGR